MSIEQRKIGRHFYTVDSGPDNSSTEGVESGSHRIVSFVPAEVPDALLYTISTDPGDLEGVSRDQANIVGTPAELIRLHAQSGEAEISLVLKDIQERSNVIVTQGSRTSLTGGATPKNMDASEAGSKKVSVLDMGQRKEIIGYTERSVTVQSGITLEELQAVLKDKGKYFPPGPTYTGATIGGLVSTNAAGAATFKYGQTRPWVKRLKVVLANGEVLDIKRGEHTAHKDGYFELQNSAGEVQRIDIPTYTMPDVVKCSAGYFAQPGMDLIDLFVGSEGTLGVISEVELGIIDKPQTYFALVPCETEDEALKLTTALRNASRELWKQRGAQQEGEQPLVGIDVAAIEYVDEKSVELLKADAPNRSDRITPPEGAKTMLIVQIEKSLADSDEDFGLRFLEIVSKHVAAGENVNLLFAEPDDEGQIKYFERMREGVPIGVNERVRKNQRENPEAGITKLATDMIVPFEHFADIMKTYRTIFEARGLEHYIWGHFSDGNVHVNVLAKTVDEVKSAKEAMMECAKEVIRLGGSPLAEHGVGKHPQKQEMLTLLYGEDGVAQMRTLKKAFDPKGVLCPGNIFSA